MTWEGLCSKIGSTSSHSLADFSFSFKIGSSVSAFDEKQVAKRFNWNVFSTIAIFCNLRHVREPNHMLLLAQLQPAEKCYKHRNTMQSISAGAKHEAMRPQPGRLMQWSQCECLIGQFVCMTFDLFYNSAVWTNFASLTTKLRPRFEIDRNGLRVNQAAQALKSQCD